jgi:formylglycine-generating enzyme required for sulfatase activity
VGTYRELVRSGLLEDAAVVQDPAALSSDPACTYLGPERASNDALPLSCISAPAAAAACAALGKRLPTEAEWEYAARSRGLRVRYPWGEDDAICAHAVIAVGRDIGVDPAPAELLIEEDTACRASAPGDAWGPRPSAALPDVTPLGIWELAGNLAEWTSDDFAPYSDDCWSNPAPPSAEPRCTAANVDGGPPSRSVRGGSWANQPFDAEPMRRANAYPDLENPIIGFRCAATL